MEDYRELGFNVAGNEKQEMLIALLAEAGYEGFEQTDEGVKAFITDKDFDEAILNEICQAQNLSFTSRSIPAQNWNASWESGFQPVIINEFAAIRADFHEPVQHVQYDLIITPKMSFGTGHHATTYLMIEAMSELDFKGKNVLDFGTGTGLLAILAKKMGAAKVMAIDYDEWSIENAAENFQRNECENIELVQSDNAAVKGSYGIILANINRNVIMENLPVFSDKLEKGGILLLSGLLEEDNKNICETAASHGFKLVKQGSRNRWIVLEFTS